MADQLDELIDLLDLEPLETNLFRGLSTDVGAPHIFGGQVLAQALVAAQRTVEGRDAHSLHAYFILPGDKTAPVVYDVERIRDGRSYATRRIVAIQHGRPIFNMSASFHVGETSLEHQDAMPDVPPPEDLEDDVARRRRLAADAPVKLREIFTRNRPLIARSVEPDNPFAPEPGPARRAIWLKTPHAIADAPGLHRAILAYISDFGLITTALRPHGVSILHPGVRMTSLDHAMWFHRPVRVDDWVLFVIHSPSAAAGRCLSRGSIFDRAGNLVASVVQEGVLRYRAS